MGYVPFPSHILGQVIEVIDAGLAFAPSAEPTEKWCRICEFIRSSFKTYPVERHREFTVVYGTRSAEFMQSKFFMAALKWSGTAWRDWPIPLPTTSALVDAIGSGAAEVRKWYERWQRTNEKGTSRSCFSAFCDSLSSGSDRYSGGAPQLVSLERRGLPKVMGTIFNGRRYFSGMEIAGDFESGTRWHNELFELCDPSTLARIPKAQEHHAPRGLGGNRG